MILLLGGLNAHPRGGIDPSLRPIEADTTIWMDEVSIVGHSVKPGRLPLAISPVAASIFTQQQVEQLHLTAPKELSMLVPNLLMPEYGSRMTSSIYVRGMGSRIDQPAMGLTVDNIPILNKDAYDLDLMEISRVEVLRGPQSTLYGRNTIGGVMNITTRSPLDEEGTELRLNYGSGNDFDVRLSSHFRAYEGDKSRLGIGVAANYGRMDGLFTNTFTGQKCDWDRTGGAALKVGWEHRNGWLIENSLQLSTLEQGGYPYRSLEEGDIAYNDPSGYERTALWEGLRIRHDGAIRIESMSSYQLLDDCMTLDQDFRPESYFTLMQQRREHALTQEFILSPRKSRFTRYSWTSGLFLFGKWSDMAAPVEFKEQGLQELIIDYVEQYTGLTPHFDHTPFPFESDFDIRTRGAALYHESYLKLGRWFLTLGLRLDGEWATMDYHSATPYGCQIGAKRIDPIEAEGRLDNSFVELLPKFSVLYRMGAHRLSTLYLSASKGYKAGGFNTQMFSDVLQASLMAQMGASFDRHYDIEKVVEYDPEKSWNFEMGGHLHLWQGVLKLDWALFFIDCTDQQLTVFPPGRTTGRMMTNAGRTHSYGAELSATLQPTDHLRLEGSYGYTHATFRDYTSGDKSYRGNFVPYAPSHTLSARAGYEIEVGTPWLECIIPSIDLRGAGGIWWNEENSLKQPLYALLGATLRFEHKNYALDIWGRNLTNTRYDLFYFKSVGREFLQQGNPRTFGATLTIKL